MLPTGYSSNQCHFVNRDFSDLNTDLLSVAELMQLEKEMLNTLFQIRTRQVILYV